jgi:hypothetical protein
MIAIMKTIVTMAMIVMVSVIVTTIITMIISDDENGSDNDNEYMYSIV